MAEQLKQRLRDMSVLSNSLTPKDALEYIEDLELQVISALSQAQEAYEAQVGLEEQVQEAKQWANYWAELWERSSNLLMQHHPAFTDTTEVISKDKRAFIKELFGEDLLVKVSVVENEDTKDEY